RLAGGAPRTLSLPQALPGAPDRRRRPPRACRDAGSDPLGRGGSVDDAQLDPFPPAPAIDRERSRHVNRAAARGDQRTAERLAEAAERDAIDGRAVGGLET